MSTNQALKIVMQVLEWKSRKGVWPKPKNETECRLIRDAFAIIDSKV